jgi:hypothetical protein
MERSFRNFSLLGFCVLTLCLLTAALFQASCSTTAPVSHPGAVSTFDSTTYDALLTIQAGIESAKTQFGSNPAAKAPLNAVIQAYDAAQASYKAYHTAAAGGGNTAAQQAALQQQVASLKTQLAAVTTQFGGK